MTKLSPNRKVSCPSTMKPEPPCTNLTPTSSSHNTSAAATTPTSAVPGSMTTQSSCMREDVTTRNVRSTASASSTSSSRSSCSSASSTVDVGANSHAIPSGPSDSIPGPMMPGAGDSTTYPSSCPSSNQSVNLNRPPHSGSTPTSIDPGLGQDSLRSNTTPYTNNGNNTKCTDVTNGTTNSSHHSSLTAGINTSTGTTGEEDYHTNTAYSTPSNSTPYGSAAGQRLSTHPGTIPTHSSPAPPSGGRHVPTAPPLSSAMGVHSSLRFDADLQKARTSVYE
ncbi:unnamed protein product [Echinostoma caproni]|uniref:Protein CBFA2T1 n=1 Tax=Echinostoma caproni TaxID=27848 RepID=A0A183AY60_9TREM|nr:unnamed protein product [Echinostoma caproni]